MAALHTVIQKNIFTEKVIYLLNSEKQNKNQNIHFSSVMVALKATERSGTQLQTMLKMQ